MAPPKVDKLITFEVAKLITLERAKGGQTNNSPAYIHIDSDEVRVPERVSFRLRGPNGTYMTPDDVYKITVGQEYIELGVECPSMRASKQGSTRSILSYRMGWGQRLHHDTNLVAVHRAMQLWFRYGFESWENPSSKELRTAQPSRVFWCEDGAWLAVPHQSRLMGRLPSSKSPGSTRAGKRHINFEHMNFLKVGTTLGQPAG